MGGGGVIGKDGLEAAWPVGRVIVDGHVAEWDVGWLLVRAGRSGRRATTYMGLQSCRA